MVRSAAVPAARLAPHRSASVVMAGLGASFLCLIFAPLLMPETYSWIENTTSESAAQGLAGAWLARLGFVLFGLAVLALAILTRSWSRLARGLHLSFGVSMVATAMFSTRSFEVGAGFDPTDDLLHSVAATAMGFAFAFGVLAVSMRRRPRSARRMALDLVALAASIGIPLLMVLDPAWAGLWQRVMFVVAYIWYGGEALTSVR